MKITKSRLAATIFYIIFGSIFVFLGFWQIERGAEKDQIVSNFEEAQTKQPLPISNNSKKWDRVYVNGALDKTKTIFIDNTIYKGVLGYKVVAPLILDRDEIILVDFGWTKQPERRGDIKTVEISSNENISVTGVLEQPELGLVLSDELFSSSWPKISQSKSIDALQELFDEKIYPFILLSDFRKDSDLTYIKPVVTNMPPVKHYGYAGQWFAMFIALTIMYIYFLRKSTNE